MPNTPWGLTKKIFSFFGAGFVDRFIQRTTGVPTTFGKCVATKLNECEPWEDHFERRSIEAAQRHVREGNFEGAKIHLWLGAKATGSKYCQETLETLIDWLARNELDQVVVQATPFYYL